MIDEIGNGVPTQSFFGRVECLALDVGLAVFCATVAFLDGSATSWMPPVALLIS